jgi:hypothetical protein
MWAFVVRVSERFHPPAYAMKGLVSLLLSLASFWSCIYAASRTSPPSGAIVVRAGTRASGEFATINAALSSVSSSTSSISLFIYPGTYNEQVDITRSGPVTVCSLRFPDNGANDPTPYSCDTDIDLRLYERHHNLPFQPGQYCCRSPSFHSRLRRCQRHIAYS